MGSSSTREAVVKTGDIVEGRYRIIRTLGEGGMGTVFLAEHALIKRKVAIKILHPELATDANVIERFMNEARAAGTLGHPNIVESTDMGFTHNHVPYIVFEFLEGALLTDEIYRVGGLPVRRAVRIASQIASALHAAHNAGVVHRDLKSDNVFLTDKDDVFDHVKVLDFGISRFLMLDDKQKGMVMGTPEFMAPEQITDPENVDRRADIYALGVILYEMLTARRPFASEDDPRQLLHRIVHEEPPPLMRPEVPHGLAETILGMMLAKNPDDRYQTMSDVEAALESFITRSDGTPVPSRRSQPIPLVDGQHDLNDIARNSKTIPRPAKVANTPYPGGSAATLTPMAMKNVMLSGAKKPYALYAIAGVGIAVGALGLMFGMRGKKDDVALTPQPTVQQPQPAAAMPVPKEAQKITVQLDADAPNAHVTFRRHIAGTPTSTQINATDVVELVEVSAPGYKTARYWLTFDRPTHLKAHLAKGTGLAEATEEETLVALGEVSTPAQPALAQKLAPMAAPTPALTARTVEKPHPQAAAPASVVEKIAIAPRKIGKTAVADDIKKIEPAEVPPIATTEAPKPETKPEQTMPEVAKPENTEEPVAKAVEPPKVEAPVPAVARPTGIDATTVSTVVGNHKNEVQKCFADGKKKNTSMKGTLSLLLQVDAAGKVHRVQIQSTLKAPLVAACVVKSASAWRFPARAGAEAATVSYPFSVD
jgi:eukaryotic-like serine/threonine-protein kinase